tara:strand:- start:8757 stop:13487 length:4731 start_codon:yes stop_codon:yes gene_type:complete
MAIDKLIPQYLNSDTDQKLIKSVEMTDNLNVRVSNDAEGTSGVVKNIKGTEVVAARSSGDSFPSGDNRVIGSIANEKNKEILFLLWNSNDNHGIYRLDMTTGKYSKLYQDDVLNFQKFSYADCDVVINEEGETLFYWTDNVNPPMKVNVQRLISGDYPQSVTSGTDEEKLLSLTVAKQPPLQAPSYKIVNNPSLKGESRIKSENYQFAYRYIYGDGEQSALSPYSSLSVANSQLVDGFNTDGAKNFFNQINVFVKNTVADVRKIVVYARRIRGEFFEIAELNNANNSNSRTVEFTDNVLGTYLSETDRNKIYDNVPQLARAQSIAGNRLMYGNYIEGYENVNTQTSLVANYHAQPEVFDLTITLEDYANTSATFRDFTIDYTEIPDSVSVASKIMLNIFIDFEDIFIAGGSTELVSLDDGELEITFQRETGNVGITVGNFSINKIRGIGSAPNFWKNVWSSITNISPNFDPGITLSTEGLQIKEVIEVPSGSTKADIKDLVKDRLESKEYSMFLNPSKNDRRFSILNTSGATPFTTESASFKGTMLAEIKRNSTGANIEEYRIRGNTAELEIHEFTDGSGKISEIVSTNKFKLNRKGLNGAAKGERFILVNASLYSGSCSLYKNIIGDTSFKSGSSHDLGIVYYDNRGRASGVQEIGDVYVNHLNDRANENDLDGRSSIVLRMQHSPPSWAKRWAPVYTGRGNIELKFQYGIKGAFVPTNNIKRSTVFSSEENIYISLNSLFRKESSYTKSANALIDYNFEEGDRLRIIKYGNDQRTKQEFKVVGYVTLNDDAETNPILDRITENAIDATTGDFLIIQSNPNATLFNYSSVIEGESKWFQDCIIEIYRDVKEREEDVYYEIGKSYSITSGAHEDERTSTSVSVTLEDGDDATAPSVRFHTNVKVFKGDVISDGSRTITVGNVFESSVVSGKFTVHGTANTTVANGTYTVQNPDTVINLSLGDVYFRVRACIVSSTQIETLTYRSQSSQNTKTEFIEDYSVSDFFKSKSSSIGRPFAYIPEAKSVRRRASITYSEPYVADSDLLSLSSFNLSLANWTDLELTNGSIQSMKNRNDALTVLQESKACQIPINRNLIQFTSGDKNITASRNVLSTPSYYAGDFGTANPESVVERFGIIYYVDSKAGKIIRISADGITVISEKGMDSFFEERFKSLYSSTDSPRVVGGFDPDNNEYLVTVEPVKKSVITIGSDEYQVPIDENNNFFVQGYVFTTNTVLWNIWGNLWNTFCGNWNDIGNGIIILDNIYGTQSVLIDDELTGSTGTINVLVTDSTYSFSIIATLDLGTGIVTLPSTTCEGTSITIGSSTSAEDGFTLSYKHRAGRWSSKYSFKPTMYVNINNELYSFFDTSSGIMWKHNVNSTRNNFYGTQYNSVIEVVSNPNPSMIKVFEAIGVEGGGNWSATLSNTDQSTTISTSDFDAREGHRYAMIPRDTLKSTGHQVYIGKVASSGVSGDKVTFTTPINKIPFVVGDELKTASGTNLVATSEIISGITDKKTIQCTNTITGIADGDNVFVEHSSRIDGDPIRDVFLKIKLTSSDTSAFEVHAVSLSYDRSRLHNDRVN